MLKVVLQYSNYCDSDGRDICKILAKNNVNILSSRESMWDNKPIIVIAVNSRNELNTLLIALNSVTKSGVLPVKVTEFNERRKYLDNTHKKCSVFMWLWYKIKSWFIS